MTAAKKMRPTGVFITGTDTSIGKTMVSCAIAAALRARNVNVGVYKPVETGCPLKDGVLVGEDCGRLTRAAGGRQTSYETTSYLYELPAAPLMAAEARSETIEPAKLRGDYQRLSDIFDFVIVEGAGGLRVPIADDYTYLNLARELHLPVVVVIGSRLGCINHGLLTLDSLDTNGIEIAGYIVNCLEGENSAVMEARAHSDVIARFSGKRDLGIFPYIPESEQADLEKLAGAAERYVDLDLFI
jgi:dethiobiotin synthetase